MKTKKNARTATIVRPNEKKSVKQTHTKEETVKKSVKQIVKKQEPKESHPMQDKVYALKGFKPTASKKSIAHLKELALKVKRGEIKSSTFASAREKVGVTMLEFARHMAHFGLVTKRS